MQENETYEIEISEAGVCWQGAKATTIRVDWEDIISGEYTGDEVIDILTADQGCFIKLENVDEKKRSEIINYIRLKIGRQLVDQAMVKERHYDQLAMIQKQMRPIILINIGLCIVFGLTGRYIDKKGNERFNTISENTSTEQVTNMLGKPLRKVSGKVYFDAILKDMSKSAKKRKLTDEEALKGLVDVVVIGQRELLEKQTAMVWVYRYHGNDYFYLFINDTYQQELIPTSLSKI